MWQRNCGTCMISGQWSSSKSRGFEIFVWPTYLCLDLSSRSKALDGSIVMGIIFYSSSFYVLSMWEWCPCQHHGCLMSMRTCEACIHSWSHSNLLLSSSKRDFGLPTCKGETSLQRGE
jgi:hypothetical protein